MKCLELVLGILTDGVSRLLSRVSRCLDHGVMGIIRLVLSTISQPCFSGVWV